MCQLLFSCRANYANITEQLIRTRDGGLRLIMHIMALGRFCYVKLTLTYSAAAADRLSKLFLDLDINMLRFDVNLTADTTLK